MAAVRDRDRAEAVRGARAVRQSGADADGRVGRAVPVDGGLLERGAAAGSRRRSDSGERTAAADRAGARATGTPVTDSTAWERAPPVAASHIGAEARTIKLQSRRTVAFAAGRVHDATAEKIFHQSIVHSLIGFNLALRKTLMFWNLTKSFVSGLTEKMRRSSEVHKCPPSWILGNIFQFFNNIFANINFTIKIKK